MMGISTLIALDEITTKAKRELLMTYLQLEGQSHA
jgi:hypothetical protein